MIHCVNCYTWLFKAVISFITSEPITCFMVVARYKLHFHVIHFRCLNKFFRSRACNTKLLLIGNQVDLLSVRSLSLSFGVLSRKEIIAKE